MQTHKLRTRPELRQEVWTADRKRGLLFTAPALRRREEEGVRNGESREGKSKRERGEGASEVGEGGVHESSA